MSLAGKGDRNLTPLGRIDELIARDTGTSRDTVRRVEIILENADEDDLTKARANRRKINQVYKHIKHAGYCRSLVEEGAPIDLDEIISPGTLERQNVRETLRDKKGKKEESETRGLPPVDDDGPPQAILTLGPDNEANQKQKEIVCFCEDNAIMTHYECAHCGNIWCPENKEEKQEVCPNPDCLFTLSNRGPAHDDPSLPDDIVY